MTKLTQFGLKVYGPDADEAHDSEVPEYRELVATASTKAGAAHIVKCVNAHEAMLTALQYASETLSGDGMPSNPERGLQALERLRAAITQAED